MALANPYFEFFQALPSSFRRHPSMAPASLELFLPEWLTLKTAIARHFSWAVPTEAAIAAIRRHASDIVEVGAGSGYWAWLMRQAGIKVAAFDADPPSFTWSSVDKGDERVVNHYPRSTLFLCWPPWGSTMAANALDAYLGKCLIYVGEWPGGNADPRFFASLSARFALVDLVSLPQWYGRDDRLTVFRRR